MTAPPEVSKSASPSLQSPPDKLTKHGEPDPSVDTKEPSTDSGDPDLLKSRLREQLSKIESEIQRGEQVTANLVDAAEAIRVTLDRRLFDLDQKGMLEPKEADEYKKLLIDRRHLDVFLGGAQS